MMKLNDRGIPKPPLDLGSQKQDHPDIIDEHFWELVKRVHDYTELPTAVLFNLYSAVRYVAAAEIPGDIIECGVHMGGSIMMMELALLEFEKSTSRKIFALDTLLGLSGERKDWTSISDQEPMFVTQRKGRTTRKVQSKT